MTLGAGDRSARTATVVKEMAVSRAEFLTVLERTFAPSQADDGESPIVIGQGRRRLEITLQTLPPRRLGALTLPRAQAVLHFVDYDAEAQATVLAAFERAFQRGGG
jgi:hypothetical protein